VHLTRSCIHLAIKSHTIKHAPGKVPLTCEPA
jgi:hypothetical protein